MQLSPDQFDEGRMQAAPQLPLAVNPSPSQVEQDGDVVTAAWARNLLYLWERKKTLTRIAIAGLLVSTAIAFSIPKEYQSTTTLMPPELQGGSNNLLAALAGRLGGQGSGGLGMLAGGLFGSKTNGELCLDLMRSGTVTGALVKRFDLQQVYRKRYMLDTIKKLNANTRISESKKSGVITITVTDTDKARAQQLARGYVEELNGLLSRVSTSSAGRERQFVEQRRVAVLAELNDAAEQLSRFSSSTSTIDIREQTRATVDAGAKLEAEVIFGRSELESLRKTYGDDNLRVRSAKARVDVLQNELQKLGGATPVAGSSLELPGNKLYPPLRRLPALGVQYAQLYRNVRIYETVYEMLSAEYETARIQEAKEIPTVNVIDAAGIPEKKSFPPRLFFMLGGMLASVLVASFLVLFRRSWTQLSDSDDIKRLLQQMRLRHAMDKGRL